MNARVFNQIGGEGKALGAIMVSANHENLDFHAIKRTQKLAMEGVDTPAQQVAIARQKAGIRPEEPVKLQRFQVVRHR